MLKKILRGLFSFLGNIKICKYPLWFVYAPGIPKINGLQFEKISKIIRDFDIVLRSYEGYLDSCINLGEWTHVGLFYKGLVVHSVLGEIQQEMLFDFCKTDAICVLRPDFYYSPYEVQKKLNFEHIPEFWSCANLIPYLFHGCDHGIKESNFLLPDAILSGKFISAFNSKEEYCK